MSTDTDPPVLMSTSQIADLENLRMHQVNHVIKKLAIRPVYRFGHCDVYAAEDITRIRAELARIADANTNRRTIGDQSPTAS